MSSYTRRQIKIKTFAWLNQSNILTYRFISKCSNRSMLTEDSVSSWIKSANLPTNMQDWTDNVIQGGALQVPRVTADFHHWAPRNFFFTTALTFILTLWLTTRLTCISKYCRSYNKVMAVILVLPNNTKERTFIVWERQRCWFPFRKRSMPFSNGRCHHW